MLLNPYVPSCVGRLRSASRFLARVLPGAKPAPFLGFIEPALAALVWIGQFQHGLSVHSKSPLGRPPFNDVQDVRLRSHCYQDRHHHLTHPPGQVVRSLKRRPFPESECDIKIGHRRLNLNVWLTASAYFNNECEFHPLGRYCYLSALICIE
jgi:hypothetical protein